ncbi:MAG: hypothetical protein ACLFU8_10990 [Anaerolineales bacterium]
MRKEVDWGRVLLVVAVLLLLTGILLLYLNHFLVALWFLGLAYLVGNQWVQLRRSAGESDGVWWRRRQQRHVCPKCGGAGLGVKTQECDRIIACEHCDFWVHQRRDFVTYEDGDFGWSGWYTVEQHGLTFLEWFDSTTFSEWRH